MFQVISPPPNVAYIVTNLLCQATVSSPVTRSAVATWKKKEAKWKQCIYSSVPYTVS